MGEDKEGCHQTSKMMAKSATTFQIWWNFRHHISNCYGTLTTTYHIQGAGAPAKTKNYVNADAFIFFREKVRPFPHLAKPMNTILRKDEKAMVQIKRDWFDTALKITKGEKRMADGKRRYKSDRKDHKVSVKLSEKDMDILKAALKRTGMTASAYIRELIRTGGNIDTSYPEDRAKAIRVIANNINQVVKLGNSQGRLYYSDIDKLQNSLDDVKKTFGEVLEVWRLQRS